MSARLRLLGQQIEPGHRYEVSLLAAQGCSLVQIGLVQSALAVAGILNATVSTTPAAMPNACRVVAVGMAPPIPLPIPVAQVLGAIRVPGMAVTGVRDLTTGTSLFPEVAQGDPGPVPQTQPPAPPPPSSAAPSSSTGKSLLVAVAIAAGVVVLAQVLA